jgi:WD40 repeat protein
MSADAGEERRRYPARVKFGSYEKRRKRPSSDRQLIARDHLEQPAGRRGGDAGGVRFDVFLSHASGDKPVVERIAEQLRREGLRVFLDSSDLTPGEHWQRELAEGLARSRTCALFVGPHPLGRWQLEELELALVWANRRRGCRVFAVLLPGAEDPFDPHQLPPFLSTRTWVDLRGSTSSRHALQRLLNAIKGIAQSSAAPTESSDDVVPYRGLASFEEEHAEFFFGRERDVQRLLEILKASPLLCVVGPSGSGKSSLVRAGLVPRLRNGVLVDVEACKVCLLRPGAHPLEALATQLAPLGAGSSMQATLNDLTDDRRSLHLAVSLALGADSPGSRVLIVVDQLEEVFTLCNDEREREQFFANLLHAAFVSGGQTAVVLTIRADFYARCADYPELAQRTARSLALIVPMDEDELRQAIEEPARHVGLFLESGLMQTILDDAGSDAGALPLLEHALLEVWRRRLADQLTLDGYVEAGRVEGALAKRAESVFSNFTTEQKQIARRLMLRLTQPGEGTEDTRRRAARNELVDDTRVNSVNEVLGRLVDARLLTTGRDDSGLEVVDVSHEALIRGWPRLRSWIDADRAGLLTHRRLTDAARDWDAHKRKPAALYRGPQLAGAREWASEHADDLSQLERDFLKASVAVDRRTKRRLQILAIGLAALTVTAATLAVWALDQRSDARTETAKVRSLGLVSSSAGLRNSRPDVSLLLAFEAYRESPLLARSNVLAALIAARVPGVLAILHGHTAPVNSVAFSSDKRMLASAADNTIRLWDVRTHKQVGATLTGHTSVVSSLAFDPDGRMLASAGDDGRIRLWDLRAHKQLGMTLTGHTGFVSSVAFSSDGRMLASAGADGKVRLWDMRTHKQLGAPLRGPIDAAFSGVAFSPDGRMLASAGADGKVRLWDMRTHKQLGAPLRGHTDVVHSVAFSPDGRMLASASDDKTVRLWDVHTHKQLGKPLTGHTAMVTSVAFRPHGRVLASASGDNTISLWDVRNRRSLRVLTGHTDSVLSVAFSGDGMIASASADSTVRLWDVRTRESLGALLTRQESVVASVAFGADPRVLASGTGDGKVRLWDVRSHKALGAPLEGHTSLVRSVAFSPKARMLASASEDSSVRLWDARTREPLDPPLQGHTDVVRSVAFSPDGRTLATASDDDTIQLWNTRTHKQLGRLPRGQNGDVQSVAFSPDGRLLASGDTRGAIQFWDSRTHKALGTALKGHGGFVTSLAFSRDGRMLASASVDSTIGLWDTRTHKRMGQALTVHPRGAIESVAFGGEGATLASGHEDGKVRLWDTLTHKQLGRALSGHKRSVWSVAFSPDGRTLASASDDKTIRLWEKILWRNTAELRTQVCNLVGTGLSRTEWTRYVAVIPYRESCS